MEFYSRIKEICEKYEKVALFVDMDGTIAEYNVLPSGFFTNKTKGVFLKAKPLNIVIDNLEKVSKIENLTIHILSLAKSNIIVEEKVKWLKKYVPFIKEENYIIVNKEQGEYFPENRDIIKFEKMKERSKEYDYLILLDDDHKILKRTQKELKDKGQVFHISSAII